jgi:hypothetical protein
MCTDIYNAESRLWLGVGVKSDWLLCGVGGKGAWVKVAKSKSE